MPPSLIALIPITLIGLWLVAAMLADEELRSPRKWKKTLRRMPHAATWTVIVFALVCGGLALWLGWLGFSEQTKEELYVNLATSLGSIAITVLVLDQLNRWRMADARKREIIEQMGSDVNDATREAVRLARKSGWLEDGSLKGANLSSAALRAARLWHANLKDANLSYANLKDASLGGANLEGANLEAADLQGARLRHANLDGARLVEANLEGAWLMGASLKGADLSHANLQTADLQKSNFLGARLWGANLKGALIGGANFESASLGGANLQGAWLGSANLRDACLLETNLWDADLLGADLRAAYYDGGTIWPDDFNYRAAGAIRYSEQK